MGNGDRDEPTQAETFETFEGLKSMPETTYYIQSNPRSFRRFPSRERWDASDRKWVTNCCEERACEITGDETLTETQFAKAFPKIPL